jgi:O-antigen chain-terminating methyltransferase
MDVGLQDLIGGVRGDLSDQVERLRAENDALRAIIEAAVAHLEIHLDESVEAVRLHAQRHAEEVTQLASERTGDRLNRLERLLRSTMDGERRASPPGPVEQSEVQQPAQASGAAEPATSPLIQSAEAWNYGVFEEEMRGPSSVVASIQRPYLTDIGTFGRADLPVLDIGCGRGEFLRLLDESGAAAVGLDVNEMFVETCREAGFEAVLGDALSYLRSSPDASLRGITAFHVVEHIPMPGVTELLASAYRVIAPGGGLLLETPDPENLAVGAHRFWFDPTHIRPVPSLLLKFMVRAAGFEDVEVRRLHPLGDLVRVEPGTDSVTAQLAGVVNEALGGPIDYLIVARRPADP